MLGLGIDSGSTVTKGALFDGEKVVRRLMIPTKSNPKKSIRLVYDSLISDDVGFAVSTGYGRALLEKAGKHVTEITCHAKGASFLCPGARTVIDIGGQDCKAIKLDQMGSVSDFIMNDKCAAGTGRFVEIMLKALELESGDLDDAVLNASPVSITSMCAVFAESEMISLLASGEREQDIAAGIVHSICRRTAVFASKLNPEGPVFFSGGLAGYNCFRSFLEKYVGLKTVVHEDSQFAGAIGASIIAYSCLMKG